MRPLRVVVHAGEPERVATLVHVHVPPDHQQRLRKTGGTAQSVLLQDEATGASVPAQFDTDSGEISFVLERTLRPGETCVLTESVGADGSTTCVAQRFPASFVRKLDRVVLSVSGEPFATYVVSGCRRPYFWPVLGPAGASVVRGQGTANHPHHTGLALNYGGHSEGGSVNIYSDWDEPPYGPGGRMLHRGFRRMFGGPVYGELVQDLTYVDADGDPFATEVRTVRWWWATSERRFVDLTFHILQLQDRGLSPFVLTIRTPTSFGIPEHGKVTNAAGRPVPTVMYEPSDYYRAAWVDASGPIEAATPDPPVGPPELRVEQPDIYRDVAVREWNGIALIDHPANDGYPSVIGKYSMAQQLTQTHYPPIDAPEGPFSFRHRVFVHAGDADHGHVPGVAADYASSCHVEVE